MDYIIFFSFFGCVCVSCHSFYHHFNFVLYSRRKKNTFTHTRAREDRLFVFVLFQTMDLGSFFLILDFVGSCFFALLAGVETEEQ